MRRLLALAFAVGAMAWVRDLEVPAVSAASVAALALGFALIGASVTGDALRRFHLPRLTGYLLFGVVVGPHSRMSSPSRWRPSCRSSTGSRRRSSR